MSKLPTRTERRESLREELLAYMTNQERKGTPMTFVQAARGHRQVCFENWRDDTDPLWRERVEILDELLASEGVGPDDWRASA